VQDRRASRDTSIEIIDTLNDKINATFADPAAKSTVEPLPMTPTGNPASSSKLKLRSGQR
jgi:hypothetical protein